VCYVPVLAVYWSQWHPVLPAGAVPWILGSGVLKTSYGSSSSGLPHGRFLAHLPARARAPGPLLSTLAAIALLGERPSPMAIAADS